MSHITIIISKVAPTDADDVATETSYEYCIPVPHDVSPRKVGEMVRRAYQRLEGSLTSNLDEKSDE